MKSYILAISCACSLGSHIQCMQELKKQVIGRFRIRSCTEDEYKKYAALMTQAICESKLTTKVAAIESNKKNQAQQSHASTFCTAHK